MLNIERLNRTAPSVYDADVRKRFRTPQATKDAAPRSQAAAFFTPRSGSSPFA